MARPKILAALWLCLFLGGCGSHPALISAAESPPASTHRTLGVNAYLWHASLDTLSFLPLASADPFGGVILTDWYTVPNKPTERVKVTIYITDRALRADAVRVMVFRQVRKGAEWEFATAEPDTAHKIEAAILTRARELRLAALGS